jgi:hypothetical protein
MGNVHVDWFFLYHMLHVAVYLKINEKLPS